MDADFLTFKNAIEGAKSEQDTFARFYDRSVKTDEFNPKTGTPVFKNVCYVEIRIKNNNTDIYDQPATEEKIARFPAAYNRYLLSKKEVDNGTPLEHFSFLTAAQVDTLKYHGILTIEKLNDLTPSQAQDLDLVKEYETAKQFVSGAKAQLSQIEWQNKVAALQKRIQELEKCIETMKTKEKQGAEAMKKTKPVSKQKNGGLYAKSDKVKK